MICLRCTQKQQQCQLYVYGLIFFGIESVSQCFFILLNWNKYHMIISYLIAYLQFVVFFIQCFRIGGMVFLQMFVVWLFGSLNCMRKSINTYRCSQVYIFNKNFTWFSMKSIRLRKLIKCDPINIIWADQMNVQ